ncbi:hypothetical protein SO802_004305 [Lithocarpus litseifolius]|uniref:Beta-catenin-like protein 1 N-terminal domain-containing protein n=1 Tax=Lithocarpus litseifolius TaxID=425828 RepID=A0AAW2E7V6_9ROSI
MGSNRGGMAASDRRRWSFQTRCDSGSLIGEGGREERREDPQRHRIVDLRLLQDLTDPDVFEDDEESDEPARVLVDALVENNMLELLVQNLQRLNNSDPDEMAAVYSTLTTVENLVEVKLAMAEMVCERTKLWKWLLGKIKMREFDSNKQYASKILAILLQNSAGGC